jgi:predicted GNAT superfamily acetyltransferase
MAGTLSPRELLVSAAATAAAAADQARVQIRSLDTVEQMTAACRLLEQVWGVREGQAFDVQPHLLRALGHGGNYLVGAYRRADDVLVGASAAFFTEPLGAAMHSHITGVASGDAGRGVGAALKWHQRQWALERGLTTITWTFDPLIARNAHFNISRLGARPQTYYVDFYGVMDDGANRGQPSDRIETVWDLSSAATVAAGRFVRKADGSGAAVDRTSGPVVDEMLASGAQVLLAVGDDGQPVTVSSGRDADLALVAIPRDVEALRRTDPQLALHWRYRLRATLALLMADRSWRVTGFVRDGWYVLSRESAPRRTGQS